MPLHYIHPAQRQALYTGEGRKNLFRVWQSAWPSEIEYGRTAYQGYKNTLTQLADRHTVPVYKAVGVFAALSPNNEYRSNMMDADNLISGWKCGKSEPEISVHTYGLNRSKAWRILQGEDPAKVLPDKSKTYNFYHNILHPSNNFFVTVDGHMVNTWTGVRVPMDKAKLTPRLYDIIRSDVQSVAGFCRVPAPIFQATLWVTWRRLGGNDNEVPAQTTLWGWEELMLRQTEPVTRGTEKGLVHAKD